jgi:hypothetical protein
MVTELIPMRFYGIDTVIYLVSAVICLSIAYKATRLHGYTGKKQHFYLAAAFTLLGIALATLTLTTAYTYYNMLYVGQIYFWIYYVAAFAAYGLLILMYTPENGAVMAPAIFFSARYFEYFNIVLFFMMAYIAFRACVNFFTTKSKPALMVAAGFLMLAAYHAILPFAAFSKLAYVVAHGAQIAGFASLLLMLLSTGKK